MDSNINLISNEILDLIHYKIIENIRCIIKNKNHSNIIQWSFKDHSNIINR